MFHPSDVRCPARPPIEIECVLFCATRARQQCSPESSPPLPADGDRRHSGGLPRFWTRAKPQSPIIVQMVAAVIFPGPLHVFQPPGLPPPPPPRSRFRSSRVSLPFPLSLPINLWRSTSYTSSRQHHHVRGRVRSRNCQRVLWRPLR